MEMIMPQKIEQMVSGAIVAAAFLLGAAGPALAAEERLAGFHVGAFGGATILDSTVTLPAAPGRPAATFVDQGGDGFIFGLRAGWGTMIDERAYAGIEGEFLVPYNVTSRLMALGAEYRARLRNEFGLYGRLGYAPSADAMVYLRAGVTLPRQSFQSVGSAAPGGADWTLVPAFGLGGEVHVTRDVALRFDVTYSIPSGENRIESWRMTAGVLWRFDLGGQ
jgi:opacity protein-like surface antigen